MTTPLIGLALISFLAQAGTPFQSAPIAIQAPPLQEIVHDSGGFAIRATDGTAAVQGDGNLRTLKLGAHTVLPLLSRSALATREAGHGAR